MHSSDFSRFGFTYGRIASISPRPPSSARILLRPFDSLGRYTRRYVSRLATGVAATVCRVPLAVISIFIRSRKRFSRVDAYRSETKRDRLAWKNADEAVCACAFAVSRGCGEKRRGCFHHYVYVLPDVVTCSRELLGSRMETGNSFFEKFE